MVLFIALGIFTLIILLWVFYSKKQNDFNETEEIKSILSILNNTNESIFITGKAGTGKSTLLKYFVSKTKKRYVVLAPTGVAAMNIAGQTIHSFFKFRPEIIQPDQIAPDFVRHGLFSKLDMVIIDEVSMVRSDLMDGIDRALRLNRDKLEEPFGGVQMVFIGDLFQLEPVVTNHDQPYLNTNYNGPYFFNAPVFQKGFKYNKKELTHIFRQQDEIFINLLNRIRVNQATFEDFCLLNSRHIDNVGSIPSSCVYLTSTNALARVINQDKMNSLTTPELAYQARLNGTMQDHYQRIFREYEDHLITEDKFYNEMDKRFPAEVNLKLKIGAQIMMTKNDAAKRWVNGSIGKVAKLLKDDIWVNLEGKITKIEKSSWEEIDYKFDDESKRMSREIQGTFVQFPIKLAWAITIHKSQGKTLEKIVIDIGNRAFSHGQVYVGLSRAKTLESITLKRQIRPQDIIVDKRIIEYLNNSN